MSNGLDPVMIHREPMHNTLASVCRERKIDMKMEEMFKEAKGGISPRGDYGQEKINEIEKPQRVKKEKIQTKKGIHKEVKYYAREAVGLVPDARKQLPRRLD